MENWNSDQALEHHGILGMKWGIRRFQPYPKGHVGGKEIGEAAKAGTSKKISGNSKKSDSSTNKKDEDLTADKVELFKKRIIDSGDLESAYAHKSLFTTNELQDVLNRYNKEDNILRLIEKKRTTGYQMVKQMGDFLNTAANITNSGINMYNNMAKISNTFMNTKMKEIKFDNEKKKDKK